MLANLAGPEGPESVLSAVDRALAGPSNSASSPLSSLSPPLPRALTHTSYSPHPRTARDPRPAPPRALGARRQPGLCRPAPRAPPAAAGAAGGADAGRRDARGALRGDGACGSGRRARQGAGGAREGAPCASSTFSLSLSRPAAGATADVGLYRLGARRSRPRAREPSSSCNSGLRGSSSRRRSGGSRPRSAPCLCPVRPVSLISSRRSSLSRSLACTQTSSAPITRASSSLRRRSSRPPRPTRRRRSCPPRRLPRRTRRARSRARRARRTSRSPTCGMPRARTATDGVRRSLLVLVALSLRSPADPALFRCNRALLALARPHRERPGAHLLVVRAQGAPPLGARRPPAGRARAQDAREGDGVRRVRREVDSVAVARDGRLQRVEERVSLCTSLVETRESCSCSGARKRASHPGPFEFSG